MAGKRGQFIIFEGQTIAPCFRSQRIMIGRSESQIAGKRSAERARLFPKTQITEQSKLYAGTTKTVEIARWSKKSLNQ